MKNLLITITFSFFCWFSNAQVVDVGWTNATGTYYIGTFHTLGVSGSCPSTTLTTFYHDVPDNYTHVEDARVENGGNESDITKITGLTLQEYDPFGSTYVIPFCIGSTPSTVGSTTIGGNTLLWNFDVGNNIIYITIL